mgnify:CR=1 FL=1
MKKNLPKTATLNDVLQAVNDIKNDIRFLRNDSTDLEDHLNNKISLSETRLKHQAEIDHHEIMDKLEEIAVATSEKLAKFENIHPNFTHKSVSN